MKLYSIIKIKRTNLLTLGTSVDELACVHSLHSNEILNSVLVSVGVSEDNFSQRGSTAWVVNDFLDNALDVSREVMTRGRKRTLRALNSLAS